jgi:hypothetical protein
MEVEGPYMHANQRLILMQKWCDTRDIQLNVSDAKIVPEEIIRSKFKFHIDILCFHKFHCCPLSCVKNIYFTIKVIY